MIVFERYTTNEQTTVILYVNVVLVDNKLTLHTPEISKTLSQG